MWLDEVRIWTHSPTARSNEERMRMRVYTTSTCILLLIKKKQPFHSLSIFQCRGGWTRSRANKKWVCCPVYNTVQNVSHDLKP